MVSNEKYIFYYIIPRVCISLYLAGLRWISTNRRYYIEIGLTVPHHQHQNYAEGIGSCFKLTVIKLFHNTPHTLLPYWCFTAIFLNT